MSQMQQIVIGAPTDADLEPRSPRTSDPVHDHVSNQLAHIWQHVLGIDSIGLDQNFFDLGGDSPLAVQMFAEIERAFGVKLPLATLCEASTISELAAILFSQASKSRWSPLVAIQPNGSRPAFFCMHGAGGNVLNYRDLSRHLGGDQPFYGLQSQGLDGNCALLTKVEEMAELYLREIRRVQPHGPYFLGGYCMGGTVAYEVAQQLISQGERVAVLALFDTLNWYKIPLKCLDERIPHLPAVDVPFRRFLESRLIGKGQISS